MLKEELEVKVQELEAENKQLKDEIKKLKADKSTGLAGWIVKSQNPKYTGETNGIQFRRGKAFVPDMPGMDHIVNVLVGDFGYTAERVEDLAMTDMSYQDQVKSSMIDVLAVPQQM